MAVINNVKCRWASVQEPNTKWDPLGVYEIEAVLTNEQAAQLVSQGLAVKEQDGEKTYRFKSKAGGTRKDGTTFKRDAPRVVDGNKQEFTDLIGNDSVVNIAYNIREWTMMGNSGVKGDLVAVQVVKHVPFAGSPVDEFDEVGGTETVSAAADDEDDMPF